MRWLCWLLTGVIMAGSANLALAQDKPEDKGKTEAPPTPAALKKELDDNKSAADAGIADAKTRGDTAWMLASSALVMLMVPGLALFYGGMVQRKNILATMMESIAALAVVGVFWIAVGYGLAFGPSIGELGFVGWSWKLFFLQGVEASDLLAATNISVYTHVMFQGMFAIITPALISGAIAERIRFWPFCIFMLLWVALVYCPLAHMVWAFDWFYDKPLDEALGLGGSAIGFLGKMGALDFAGGTVVHIAAGMAGLACALVLRKRTGYPEQPVHPNSMVLTLTGAALLWFGWFGFNGGSAVASTTLAASAFSATQAAAAAAGLSWIIVEWLHKGKPTALGMASGIVAGLVAVTPASGYVYIWGGLIIGAIAGAVCYFAVQLKSTFGYDDSLDAFGVHGVGGFLGAVLTGVFCYYSINSLGNDGMLTSADVRAKQVKDLEEKKDKSAGDKANLEKLKGWSSTGQLTIQFKAAGFAVIYAFVLSLVLAVVVQGATGGNFSTSKAEEMEGLDETEHGESGFDFGQVLASARSSPAPRSASTPPNAGKRFSITIDGASQADMLKAWSEMCQAGATPPSAEFKAVYPHLTTISGNKFRFSSGDPNSVKDSLAKLFSKRLNTQVKANVDV